MLILGLSAPKRDAAAALLSDRGLEAAIEESKIVRTRSFSGVPSNAIQFCLARTNVTLKDVPIIAVASKPRHSYVGQKLLQTKSTLLRLAPSAFSHSWTMADSRWEAYPQEVLREMKESLKGPILYLEHQLCHAASTYYASPFDRALILTLDEGGDGLSGTVAIGEGNRIRTLQTVDLPHSVGLIYSQVTHMLGFTAHLEEHKTQWLSLQGEPAFNSLFLEMFRGSKNGKLRLDLGYFDHRFACPIEFSDKFYSRLGLTKSSLRDELECIAPHLACSVQTACTTLVCNFLDIWRKRTRATKLCLAGGVFLNTLLVGDVEKQGQFDEIFVQPASGNAGCALGAAWLTWHQVLGRHRQNPLPHVYWGPSFTAQQVKEVLDNCKAPYCWSRTDIERNEETVRLLESGRIVAWFQGAAEFGPRALGNRSLLASPWAPYVRQNLNDYIKKREYFRPFALSVTAEDCQHYFDCSRLVHFMTSIGWARESTRKLIKDFLLPGNRVRLHVVERGTNPALWSLLKKFGERSPAPFLINTSFNLHGEPLVISPRDAVRSFFCSGVDALSIDGFMLSKNRRDFSLRPYEQVCWSPKSTSLSKTAW